MDNEKIPELNKKNLSSEENISPSTGAKTGKKRSNLKGRWRRANGRVCVAETADENKPGIITGESVVLEENSNHESFTEDAQGTPVSLGHKREARSEGFSRARNDKGFSREQRNKTPDETFSPSYGGAGKDCCVCGGVKSFFKRIIAFFGGKNSNTTCSLPEKERENKSYDRSRRSSNRNFQKNNKKPFRRNHSSRKRPQQ